MSDESDEIIYVPTPRRFLTKVYETIAQLEAGESVEPIGAASSNGAAPNGAITQALAERMYRESWDPHKRLMEYLADHPNEWIGTSEIAQALQLEHGSKSLAGSMGAFGRRAEHRYGGLKPWETRWRPEEGQAEHRMSQEVATWIKDTAS